MSYTKTTWQNGDIITAEKLNHIEDGVANLNGVLIVHIIEDEPIYESDTLQERADKLKFDKTFAELETAMENDKIILVAQDGYYMPDGASPLIEMDCSVDSETGVQSFSSYYCSFFSSDGSISEISVQVYLFLEEDTPTYSNLWSERYCSIEWIHREENAD